MYEMCSSLRNFTSSPSCLFSTLWSQLVQTAKQVRKNVFRIQFGLLKMEVVSCLCWWDSESEKSQLRWSKDLERVLSHSCCFLHVQNSLLSDIAASFISAAPHRWFVPTPAVSMQWRLWVKCCQRNMTRSLFPLLQLPCIDYHWFPTRATPSYLTLCLTNQVTIEFSKSIDPMLKGGQNSRAWPHLAS